MTPSRHSDGSRAAVWSQLHHGIDPRTVPLLLFWLRGMWAVAARLRGTPPTAITAAGVVLAAAAVTVARSLPGPAAVLVAAAALCDGLDGAVAVVADRASVIGARADAVADRICDVLFAAVLWRCGAPWWLSLLAGGFALAVDAVRRLRRIPDRITVAERPTFAVCAVLGCASAAVSAHQWPVVTCAAVWLAATCVGLAQLGGQATPPR